MDRAWFLDRAAVVIFRNKDRRLATTAQDRAGRGQVRSGRHESSASTYSQALRVQSRRLYVNDVPYYASRYGGGTVPRDANDCGPRTGNPKLPSLTNERVAKVVACAKSHDGDTYRIGRPTTGDCSSFTQGAYAQIGVKMPGTATAQHTWVADGKWHTHPSRP
jgi:cell wall-associated NlpC family hydrolase